MLSSASIFMGGQNDFADFCLFALHMARTK
jgi:hypothetical protein